MSTNGILTQKEKELIAVGVSIAAGCQPCTSYHFKAVREAGASETEIRQAVDDAAPKEEEGCDDDCSCNEDSDSQSAANTSGESVDSCAEAKAVSEPCGCG